MALIDDIEEIKKIRVRTKAEILEEYRDEILEMINLKVSIKKQIELILKNEILEKIDAKEYRNILIKHFGYRVNSRSSQKIIEEKEETKTAGKKLINPATSAKDILSQDINLLG